MKTASSTSATTAWVCKRSGI